jgi:hypothetical protein
MRREKQFWARRSDSPRKPNFLRTAINNTQAEVTRDGMNLGSGLLRSGKVSVPDITIPQLRLPE